jgi:hypothetical protein
MLMDISEDELRSMVRDAIARHGVAPAPPALAPPLRPDPSHGRLSLVAGGDADGNCLIEPSVRCNHCGYCQSLGH